MPGLFDFGPRSRGPACDFISCSPTDFYHYLPVCRSCSLLSHFYSILQLAMKLLPDACLIRYTIGLLVEERYSHPSKLRSKKYIVRVCDRVW